MNYFHFKQFLYIGTFEPNTFFLIASNLYFFHILTYL